MARVLAALVLVTFLGCSGADKSNREADADTHDAIGDVLFPADGAPLEDATDTIERAPDAPDTVTSAEVTTECNTFGCACGANEDCLDGLCVEGPDGWICTKVCSLECPDGFDCLTTTAFGPDPLSLCVPRHVPLCRPCLEHSDCASLGAVNQGRCLPAADPDDGSFCGTACDDGLPCPEGYACQAIDLEGGGQTRQCRPVTGTCECLPGWASEPFETACRVRNEHGSCPGRRSCGTEGLLACDGTAPAAETCNRVDDDCDGETDDIVGTACLLTRGTDSCPGVTACVDGQEVCTGKPPADETCNGEDDDCDGSTDEQTCFDGLPCTSDVCAGGQCSNALTLGACLVDGVCYEAGQSKPDDRCQLCQPAVSTSSFSLATGSACDDLDPCTTGDACTDGQCAGRAYACDDGLACTRDLCDGEGGCSAQLAAGNCLIEGACVSAGTRQSATTCRVCDADQSPNAWAPADGATCDDGDACTMNDACAGFGCQGTPFSCDDGDACTLDVCDGKGGCTHTVATSKCIIAGTCYAAGFAKPDEPCYVCDPSKSDTSWSTAAPGTPCDDDDACTASDGCQAGACRGRAYTCNDGLACTDDECDGRGGCIAPLDAATCVIDGACVPEGTRKEASGCLGCVPALSTKTWSPLDGQTCDDGDACSSGDRCAGDACVGVGYACDDGNACTVDSCNGDGTCAFVQAASSCIIDGACYAATVTKPGERCLACRPELSATQWSPVATGTGCDDGNACTQGDTCQSGICAGASYDCDDGRDCTSEACDGAGGCDVEIKPGACLVDGVCRVAGDLAAAGGCLVCNPSAANDAWSPRNGQACDDDSPCTKNDTCVGETCAGVSYTCDDGITCTDDSCDGDGTCTFTLVEGACLIGGVCHPDGAQKAGEPCFACRPDISGTNWSPALIGTECDDGKPCTSEDECSNGLCAGTAYTCDDGKACTADACDGEGGCLATILPGSCLIDGACVASGTLKTAGGCLWCNPSVDPHGWSANDGASCNDQVACTSADTCRGSSCQGTAYTCDDALSCTNDSCKGDGTCNHVQAANTCLIAGVCYAADAIKPDEPCRQCRPDLSATTWSPVKGAVACDDGQACTKQDTCVAGSCVGTAYTCSDGLACTTDACVGDGTCSYTTNAGSCLIGGTCYSVGTPEPGNPCRQCAAGDRAGWSNTASGTSCSDGQLCTQNDKCNGSGACAGTSYSCDDQRACTADACKGDGTCTNAIVSGWCLIGGACIADGATSPGEECLACRPTLSSTEYRPVINGTTCNDETACTMNDKCTAGSCLGTAYTCNDGKPCTSDACKGDGSCLAPIDPGSCLIGGVCYDDGDTLGSGASACLVCDSEVSQQSWLPNDQAPCDDGVACTAGDACSGSTCGGAAYSCDDGNACTLDSCKGDGTCNNIQASDTCIIGGVCYAGGVPKPGEPCFACRPEISGTTWSAVAAGAPCDDGAACTKNDKCNAGACAGTTYVCNDGLACTTDACDGAGGCSAAVNAGSCAIEGACYANGALKTPGGCLVCSAALSPTAWYPNTGATCNDGVACTKSDVCSGSTCGGTAYSCDDALTCTNDSCNGNGTCTHTQVADTCLIGGVCYAPGTIKAGEPCLQCRPDLSPTAWSPVQGTVSCSDGNPCTKNDTCGGGSCSGTPYICNDNLACTTDTCLGDGTCSASVNAGSCAISGACYADGTTDPENACKRCTAASNPTGWSNKTNGTTCNDAQACTQGDKCTDGTCAGTAYSCDDGLTCTNDSCNGDGNCGHAQVANTCLIGGACFAANAVKKGDPCLQCRPDLSATTWSPVQGTVSCNDGNACTKNDTCGGGSCAGTAYVCNDGLSCTTDVCNGDGTCSAPPNAGFCAIGNACYADGTTNPSNPCKVCNAAADPTGWSNKAQGTTCNDGVSCTHTDVCNATGTCGGTAYTCNDGLSCTSDSCTGAVNGCNYTVTVGCRIGGACITEGAFNPSNPCQQCIGATSRTAWSPNTGNSCNDGNACTYTDKCTSGVCGGTAYTCNDNLSCTSDVCNGSGGCTYPLISGNCLISGTCYANNATQPGNVCSKCNTSSSTTSWSYNNVSCNDLDACSDYDWCTSATVCDGTDRVDGWESNNSRPGRNITNITDCAAYNEHSLTATIYGPGDVDWYRFRDSDSSGCDFFPTVGLSVPASADLDLEVYFTCVNGATPTKFECDVGSRIAGQYGCISQAVGSASERVVIDACCTSTLGVNCTGDDDGYLDVRVWKYSGTPTCNDNYTLSWGDD